MPAYRVKVKDKLTGKYLILHVSGNFAKPEDAVAHVQNLPPSHGGTHPGFDEVELVKDEPAPAVA